MPPIDREKFYAVFSERHIDYIAAQIGDVAKQDLFRGTIKGLQNSYPNEIRIINFWNFVEGDMGEQLFIRPSDCGIFSGKTFWGCYGASPNFARIAESFSRNLQSASIINGYFLFISEGVRALRPPTQS